MIFDMKQPPPSGSKFHTRRRLFARELPSRFAQPQAEESLTGPPNGGRFTYQKLSLRMGRMARFAAVGAFGTVVNLLVMGLLVHAGFNMDYVVAAAIAAEISILHNFVLQERCVFRDMREGAYSRRDRLTQHLLFNNAEALIRLPLLILLVETMHVLALLAQALTLAIAFVARFLFVSHVVYRPKTVAPAAASRNHEAAA
jgi:dolichol-phosphate mannosyltransferase